MRKERKWELELKNMTKKYSIKQLKFADEVCFSADMYRLMARHWPDNSIVWCVYYNNWLYKHKRSIISFIMEYSREDYDSVLVEGRVMTLGMWFQYILDDLIKDYS